MGFFKFTGFKKQLSQQNPSQRIRSNRLRLRLHNFKGFSRLTDTVVAHSRDHNLHRFFGSRFFGCLRFPTVFFRRLTCLLLLFNRLDLLFNGRLHLFFSLSDLLLQFCFSLIHTGDAILVLITTSQRRFVFQLQPYLKTLEGKIKPVPLQMQFKQVLPRKFIRWLNHRCLTKCHHGLEISHLSDSLACIFSLKHLLTDTERRIALPQ